MRCQQRRCDLTLGASRAQVERQRRHTAAGGLGVRGGSHGVCVVCVVELCGGDRESVGTMQNATH
jgi:hypothetical protein